MGLRGRQGVERAQGRPARLGAPSLPPAPGPWPDGRPGASPWLLAEAGGALGPPRSGQWGKDRAVGQGPRRQAGGVPLAWRPELWGGCLQSAGRGFPRAIGHPLGLAPPVGRGWGESLLGLRHLLCLGWLAEGTWGRRKGTPVPTARWVRLGTLGWGGPFQPPRSSVLTAATQKGGIAHTRTDLEIEAQSPLRGVSVRSQDPVEPGSLPEFLDFKAHKDPFTPSGCPLGTPRGISGPRAQWGERQGQALSAEAPALSLPRTPTSAAPTTVEETARPL